MLYTLIFSFVLGQSLASNPWTPEKANPSWTNWTARHEALLSVTKLHGLDEKLVFIGDSITEGWQWDQKAKDIWAQHYTPRHAYNYGIGGDRTEHILWRIENKEFDGLKAKVSVLMIGTNNLGMNNNEDITHGVREILHQLSVKMPTTKVILLAVLPRGEPLGTEAKKLNVLLKKLADEKTVYWLDMWSAYETPEGKQKTELYVSDHLHLNSAGYDVWQKTMEPLLSKLYA